MGIFAGGGGGGGGYIMKRDFSLVSPERQKVENINWKLCFLCQIDLPSEQVVYPFKRKCMIHNVYFIVCRISSKETPSHHNPLSE